jgi:hypothetical protein
MGLTHLFLGEHGHKLADQVPSVSPRTFCCSLSDGGVRPLDFPFPAMRSSCLTNGSSGLRLC